MLAFVIAALGLGMASCSHGSEKTVEATLPSPFVLAPNSHVVGGIFDEQFGRTAVVEIERDPVGVYEAYTAQARKVGVPFPGSGAHQIFGAPGCRLTPPGTRMVENKEHACYDLGSTCRVGRGTLRCEARASGATGRRIGVTVSLAWGGNARLLVLTVSSATPTARDASSWHFRAAAARFDGPVPDAQAVAPVSTPGRPFGSLNNASRRGYRHFTLEPGSRVIADAPGKGFAVMEITGDAKDVLTRYAKQLAAPDDKVPKISERELPGGGTTLSFKYAPLGGGFAMLLTDASHQYVKVNWASD